LKWGMTKLEKSLPMRNVMMKDSKVDSMGESLRRISGGGGESCQAKGEGKHTKEEKKWGWQAPVEKPKKPGDHFRQSKASPRPEE